MLGDPIAHSLSPVLHRAGYAATGLAWEYDAHRVVAGGLSAFLAGLDADWRGLALTMPLKREAVGLVDALSDTAPAGRGRQHAAAGGDRGRGQHRRAGCLRGARPSAASRRCGRRRSWAAARPRPPSGWRSPTAARRSSRSWCATSTGPRRPSSGCAGTRRRPPCRCCRWRAWEATGDVVVSTIPARRAGRRPGLPLRRRAGGVRGGLRPVADPAGRRRLGARPGAGLGARPARAPGRAAVRAVHRGAGARGRRCGRRANEP